MLKKAGIVVATAAAGLLAVSPLAFAGDKGEGHHGVNNTDQDISPLEQHQGLVNVSDNNLNVPIELCGTLQNVDVLRILSNNSLGLLAPGGPTGNANSVTCTQDASAASARVNTNQN